MWFLIVYLFVCKVILALGDYMNVQCHSCIGGTNIGEDIRKLDYGQHIVSGTPGRVFGNYILISFGPSGLCLHRHFEHAEEKEQKCLSS